MRLQQLAKLIAVACVDGHNDVIQQGKRKPLSEQPLHQCEIEADAHPVLMPCAMEGPRGEQAAIVETDIEREAAGSWRQLRSELDFIVFVDRPVVRAEIFLKLFV